MVGLHGSDRLLAGARHRLAEHPADGVKDRVDQRENRSDTEEVADFIRPPLRR